MNHVILSNDVLIIRSKMLDEPNSRSTWPAWVDNNGPLIVSSIGGIIADYGNCDKLRKRYVKPIEWYLYHFSGYSVRWKG